METKFYFQKIFDIILLVGSLEIREKNNLSIIKERCEHICATKGF